MGRNMRRSTMTIFLNSAATALLIFYIGIFKGQYTQILKNAVEIFPGYLQVTGTGYIQNPNYDNLIFNLDEVKQVIDEQKGVQDYSVRFMTYGLFSAGSESASAIMTGIDPEKEPRFSKIKDLLIEGEFLEPGDEDLIYLGKPLAQKLKLKVGDELSFVSSAIDYSFAARVLKVKGIYQSAINEFGESMSFLTKSYMDREFMTENAASMVVILPENPAQSEALAKELNLRLDSSLHEAITWKVYLQEIVQLLEINRIVVTVLIAIFIVIIFFVIMIYSLINIYGRTREIGVMRAIGVQPLQVLIILACETLFLALLSVSIGAIIGGAAVWHLQENPIPLEFFAESARQYSNYGFEIKPEIITLFSWKNIIEDILIILGINFLAIIYPVYKVTRMKPVEAIHFS